MYEYYILTKYGWKIGAVAILVLPFFLIIANSFSLGGSEEAIATAYFSLPFEDHVSYTITSEFGERIDPFTFEKSFHSGLDLSAPTGTSIVACADGIVYEVGYSETGLGNYVYIEHDLGTTKLYSIYGHMLDNSIVVKKGEKIKSKDKSGRSTGIHLHFMISKNKISFNKTDLMDPYLILKY